MRMFARLRTGNATRLLQRWPYFFIRMRNEKSCMHVQNYYSNGLYRQVFIHSKICNYIFFVHVSMFFFILYNQVFAVKRVLAVTMPVNMGRYVQRKQELHIANAPFVQQNLILYVVLMEYLMAMNANLDWNLVNIVETSAYYMMVRAVSTSLHFTFNIKIIIIITKTSHGKNIA